MKIALVYPPNEYLEAPPLGISYLKGYLAQNLRDARITNIDLNLYGKIQTGLLLGLCAYCVRRKKCRYYELSGKNIKIFYKEQTRCALRLFENVIGANLFLNETGHPALKYLERGFRSYISLIAKSNPDAIGISLADYSQLLFGLFLAKLLKRRMKSRHLIIGGSFTNHCRMPQRLLDFDFVDFCVYGDGELPLKILLEKIRGGEASLEDVPNLIYRKADKIIKNKRGYYKRFSELPYPVFDNIDRYKCIPVLGSFGCPHGKCTFCSFFKDGKFQQKQIENLIAEIKYYIDTYKKKVFVFWDNSLTAAQLKLISEKIIDNRLDINYRVMCKFSRDFNQRVLKLASKSGCRFIFWGMESTNQRILDLMRKYFSFTDFLKMIRISFKSGIQNSVNIILFFPGQKEKELLSDMRFAAKNYGLFRNIGLSYFYTEEGDYIYRHPNQFNIYKLEKKKLYSHPQYTDYGLYSHYLCMEGLRIKYENFFHFCTSDSGYRRVPKYLFEACYYYVKKDYKKARESLNKYLQDNVSNSVFLLAGLSDKELHDLSKRKMFFDSGLKYNKILKGFSESLTPVNAKSYFDNRHFPLSDKKTITNTAGFISRFLKWKFKKDYKELLVAYGYCAIGKYSEAVIHANKAKKILIGELEPYFLVGSCYDKMGLHAKALMNYKEALSLSDNNPGIYLGLGNAYYNLKEYREAIGVLEKAIALKGKEANAHLLLGESYEKLGRHKEAIAELRKAEELDRFNPEINSSLSVCYGNTGRIKKASEELKRSLFKFKRIKEASIF